MPMQLDQLREELYDGLSLGCSFCGAGSGRQAMRCMLMFGCTNWVASHTAEMLQVNNHKPVHAHLARFCRRCEPIARRHFRIYLMVITCVDAGAPLSGAAHDAGLRAIMVDAPMNNEKSVASLHAACVDDRAWARMCARRGLTQSPHVLWADFTGVTCGWCGAPETRDALMKRCVCNCVAYCSLTCKVEDAAAYHTEEHATYDDASDTSSVELLEHARRAALLSMLVARPLTAAMLQYPLGWINAGVELNSQHCCFRRACARPLAGAARFLVHCLQRVCPGDRSLDYSFVARFCSLGCYARTVKSHRALPVWFGRMREPVVATKSDAPPTRPPGCTCRFDSVREVVGERSSSSSGHSDTDTGTETDSGSEPEPECGQHDHDTPHTAKSNDVFVVDKDGSTTHVDIEMVRTRVKSLRDGCNCEGCSLARLRLTRAALETTIQEWEHAAGCNWDQE